MNFWQVVAIIGVFVGPLATYLVAAKKLSGKIKTSEASELWAESRSIRQDLIDRNKYLRTIIDGCESKIALLETRIDELELKNEQLHLENGNLKNENRLLHKENESLRLRVKELELRVKELENGR